MYQVVQPFISVMPRKKLQIGNNTLCPSDTIRGAQGAGSPWLRLAIREQGPEGHARLSLGCSQKGLLLSSDDIVGQGPYWARAKELTGKASSFSLASPQRLHCEKWVLDGEKDGLPQDLK